MYAILDPAIREARVVSAEILEGHDTTGCTVLEVADDFTWATNAVDWDTLEIVEDLTTLKAGLINRINEQAELTRTLFITAGAGQALTYLRKENEARAWTAESDPGDFPFLAAEASALGIDVATLAPLVLAQADAWVTIGSAIEGLRRGAVVAVGAAETVEAAQAAAMLDWEAIE